MKKILKYVLKELILFLIGGSAYYLTEILFRGYSHISMFIVGAICFILIGEINQVFPWDMALTSQMMLSSLIITSAELISGVFLNIYLNLGVWDYSEMPYNFLGQICLLLSVVWFFF